MPCLPELCFLPAYRPHATHRHRGWWRDERRLFASRKPHLALDRRARSDRPSTFHGTSIPSDVGDRRQYVDHRRRSIVGTSRAPLARILDEEGNGGDVREVRLVAWRRPAPGAEADAVIGGDDDQSVVVEPGVLQLREDVADITVYVPDLEEISLVALRDEPAVRRATLVLPGLQSSRSPGYDGRVAIATAGRKHRPGTWGWIAWRK